MNIIEASKEDRKITGSIIKRCGDKYWQWIGNVLVNDQGEDIEMVREILIATDYEFYEEAIRPEKAKEVWKSPKMTYFTIKHPLDGFRFVSQEGVFHEFTEFTCFPTHGQGGWTREYPPVQDNDIERVTIEDAVIFEGVVDYIAGNCELMDKLRERISQLQEPSHGLKAKLTFEYKKEGEG